MVSLLTCLSPGGSYLQIQCQLYLERHGNACIYCTWKAGRMRSQYASARSLLLAEYHCILVGGIERTQTLLYASQCSGPSRGDGTGLPASAQLLICPCCLTVALLPFPVPFAIYVQLWRVVLAPACRPVSTFNVIQCGEMATSFGEHATTHR